MPHTEIHIKWMVDVVHSSLVREYHYRRLNPHYSSPSQLITEVADISWNNLSSINFEEYAVTQTLDGVRCHVLCDMDGFVYSLFNIKLNHPNSRLRRSESIIRIGRTTKAAGYLFEAVHCIEDNSYHCFDVVQVGYQVVSESLYVRNALVKEIVESIGIRELIHKEHFDLLTFSTTFPLLTTTDVLFTKLLMPVGRKAASLRWRSRVTMNFSLSLPVGVDEYDLFTGRMIADPTTKYYGDDVGRLLLPYDTPSRIKLKLFELPRLSRRNVVELALTGNVWTFIRHRPDMEYASTLSEILASLEVTKQPISFEHLLRRAGIEGYCSSGTHETTLKFMEYTASDVVESALLQKMPDSLLLFMAGLFLTIVDIKRLSTTSVAMWATCDNVRLSAPILCFDMLSTRRRNEYFQFGSKGIRWAHVDDILRGKKSIDSFDITGIQECFEKGMRQLKGHTSFYTQFVQPLMQLCSFRTIRELSLFLFNSSAYATYITSSYYLDGALVISAIKNLASEQ